VRCRKEEEKEEEEEEEEVWREVGGWGRARQGTCLDVLALRQDIKTLVHHFACSVSSVLGQQPGDVPQPHFGAGAELAAHSLQCLLC